MRLLKAPIAFVLMFPCVKSTSILLRCRQPLVTECARIFLYARMVKNSKLLNQLHLQTVSVKECMTVESIILRLWHQLTPQTGCVQMYLRATKTSLRSCHQVRQPIEYVLTILFVQMINLNGKGLLPRLTGSVKVYHHIALQMSSRFGHQVHLQTGCAGQC